MIRVGVVRGGTGPEYQYSLDAGAQLLRTISENLSESHKGVDILVTRDGTWHIRGREVTAGDISNAVDVLFPFVVRPAHAGSFSLHEIGVPIIQSAQTCVTERPKTIWLSELARHPDITGTDSMASYVSNKLPPPWVVRLPEQSLPYTTIKTRQALSKLFAKDFSKIVGGTIETLAFGEDIAVLITDSFRGEHPYAFPPVVLGSYSFSGFMLTSPRLLRGVEAKILIDRAKEIYSSLGIRHLASIHFTRAKDGMHVGAVETNPLLHPLRYIGVALEAVGSHMPEFIKHIVGLAKTRKVQ